MSRAYLEKRAQLATGKFLVRVVTGDRDQHMGQVQGFSAWKGLANMLLGLLAVAVSILVLGVIAALLVAR